MSNVAKLFGGGGAGGGVTLNVTAMDSRDVVRALGRNGAVTKAIAVAHRNFTRA